MDTTLPKPFVFVLMPFAEEFDDIYKFGIKGAADDVGAYAERLDEQIFTEGMLDRIFNQIAKADVVIADLTGRNPNVFYEVGYAHALGKIVILLTHSANDIPFDLKHRQHTVYGGKIDTLRRELVPRLQWAIIESKKRVPDAGERFSVHLLGVALPRDASMPDAPTIDAGPPGTKFGLPFKVRNDSLRTIRDVDYVYLFAEPDCPLVPFEHVPAPDGRTIIYDSTPSLDPMEAAEVDAPDGLKYQYRLPIQFGALPPGAAEQAAIWLKFKEEVEDVDSVFRLRIHTDSQLHEYCFRLRMRRPEGAAEGEGVAPPHDGEPGAPLSGGSEGRPP